MKQIIVNYWQTFLVVALIAASAWIYLSPGGQECRSRGGTYYLDGGCGVFVWQQR